MKDELKFFFHIKLTWLISLIKNNADHVFCFFNDENKNIDRNIGILCYLKI